MKDNIMRPAVRTCRKHSKRVFSDLLLSVFESNARALERKAFTAGRVAAVSNGRHHVCLALKSAALEQLLRMGAATVCHSLNPPEGLVWLELNSGGMITVPAVTLPPDVQAMIRCHLKLRRVAA